MSGEVLSSSTSAASWKHSWSRLGRDLLWLALMAPIFGGIFYLAYWLRFDGAIPLANWASFQRMWLWVIVIKLIVFGGFRFHRGWSRYVTFYDLIWLAEAATVSVLVVALADRLWMNQKLIPRSVLVLDWGITLVGIGGMRAILRMVYERSWLPFFSRGAIPIFIVGANDAGEALLRTLSRRNTRWNYVVVGFVDEDPSRVGSHIGGVPVVGTLDHIASLAQKYEVQEILILSDALPGRAVRRLIQQTQQLGVRVRVLPSYEQIISGRVTIRPRPVAIEDLLRREPVQLDLENIRHWIDGRRLLVTGSAGSIGSEICRQLIQFSPSLLVLIDRSETGQFFLERELQNKQTEVPTEVLLADVLDRTRMEYILDRYRPEIVFHAAAYKHVPLLERHPTEAVKNIVRATRQLADLAMQKGVRSFVLISTDKAVNPSSVMGACKRAAEIYVQSLRDLSPCRFVTVRFGNVLDSAGSVVPVFRQQIAEGGPVTVTDPRMCRYFMTIPEAAKLVIQAGAIGRSGEILLLDMGEPVRILDLAEDMIRLSGLRPGVDIDIVFTGIRPGEKLSEELHLPGEKRLPTSHPKILLADCTRRDPQAVRAAILRLEQLAEQHQDQAILRALEELIPQFQARRFAEERFPPVSQDRRQAA
ncbi:MAG: polysaccharide biosynthesis protein [Thermoguttaceae bacterium]|nr:polysaccharide biosynthesis protein [Thermoguttaceae bacterium]MDW8036419.1 nucleoside-diphosphate sugar epimerase/dehydratase [Thermoguttaceae bacterium]